jgi:16S rRNA (cytosine967-C5)-methyltransferase
LLRKYIRLSVNGNDLLKLPQETIQNLGIFYSFPDWIIQLWIEQFGKEETKQLCNWFNQPPTLDLRVNPLKSNIDEVKAALIATGLNITTIPYLPQALRITGSTGSIQKLAGFQEGWWTIQDSSAQLVSYLLDPQPNEVIIDGCAAPGGKTTHIAELMGDQGKILGCDRTLSRLKKVQQNAERLQLKSISLFHEDFRQLSQFKENADKILLDVPCSGLGTLHKRPDLRWRQTSAKIKEIALLQQELLEQGSTYLKPNGILVYATCTLHPLENEKIIESFLKNHSNWKIIHPKKDSPAFPFITSEGWIKVLPHHHNMDGFFMVKLQRGI